MMKELKLEQLAAWCGTVLDKNSAGIIVRGVQSDSRKVQPGDLFVAIAGERVDGHDYIAAAVERGAVAALVSHPVDAPIPCMLVDDTLKAYGAIAAGYRRMLPIRAIGITGSVGKTTTKEMIACVLSTVYRTAKTAGNHNNNLGLPMTIMDMPADTQVAVLEMGMNHFGEMAYLTSIARPNIAVITNIGTMHIEHLGSREGILQAKLEILKGVPDDGIGIFNGDEPLLWNVRNDGGHRKYYFGIENKLADLVASDIVELDDGMRFQVTGMGQQFELFVPAIGHHTVYNALCATATALLLDIKPEKIQSALSSFQNTGMRQRIYPHGGMTIIEDCYNAGPESTEAALNVLESYPGKGRRIAVLGDMLELGSRSSAEHYRIGRLAAQKADMLFTYGANAVRMITGAITGGMTAKNAEHFDTHEDLAHVLKTRVAEGDIILFKGSRGMKMERALHLFLDEEDK